MSHQQCFIEFDIPDEKNFYDLSRVYDLVRKAKNTEQPEPDQFWLDHFPEYALKQFYFLSTDLKPSYQTAEENEFTWHFYSLIELLQLDYEIEYGGLFRISNHTGRIEYNPYAYPYGGMTGLVTFIKSFNCIPTKIDDGTSVYKITFMNNGNFNIKDLNDPGRPDSSIKLFDGVELLRKFAARFKN